MIRPALDDLLRARDHLRRGEAIKISDRVLITLGNSITDAPARPSEASDWADREAIPLINELAFRLRAALLWIQPPSSGTISAEGLTVMGFRRDDTAGHPIWIREALDDIQGCHTALHLLPGQSGWHAEIHNWQTDEDGQRECDVNQIAGIPRTLRTYADLRRLCAAISEHWAPVLSLTPGDSRGGGLSHDPTTPLPPV